MCGGYHGFITWQFTTGNVAKQVQLNSVIT